jgi:hypothetical protein
MEQSEQPDRPTWSDVTARLQNLRNLLSSERHLGIEQQRAFEALDREMGDQMAEYEAGEAADLQQAVDTSSVRETRRRDLAAHLLAVDNSAGSDDLPHSSTSTTASHIRRQRRALRPSERLQRYQRERVAQHGRSMAAESYASPSNLSPAPSTSDRSDQPASKRRKLDNGTYDDEECTFSYGYHGQVVPGQLRLEIVTCDGGEYSDPHQPMHSYPQNVLKDDASVYCTKSNKCNLLFKHVGGMPFTLTKIVVKAPPSGFDAPIQEGLVFITMEDDDLLDRTSQYDMRWSPSLRRRRSDLRRRYREGNWATRDYLNSTRSPLRSIDRSRYLSDPTNSEDEPQIETPLVSGFNVIVADPSDEEQEQEPLLSPRPWHDDEYSLRSYVDRYRPVYRGSIRADEDQYRSSSDSESYEPARAPEVPTSGGGRERLHRQQADVENSLAHRNRMLDLMRAQQIRENDQFYRDREEEYSHTESRRPYSSHYSASRRDEARAFAHGAPASSSAVVSRTPPRPLTPFEEVPPKSHVEKEATLSKQANTVVPHARFSIRICKSSTAIKFDPPV